MWRGRLFGKSSHIDRTGEPTGLHSRAQPATGGAPKRDPAEGEDQCENSILGLLGSHLDDGDSSDREHARAPSTDGNDLLHSLYAHYCRALDRPQSLVSGAWVPSGLPVHADSAKDPVWSIALHGDTGNAISDIFGDIDSVDQAFGTLRPGMIPEPHEPDTVPEILRLFAPPEYKAKGRVDATIPPALTQREHHTLAIDSPLTELRSGNREMET